MMPVTQTYTVAGAQEPIALDFNPLSTITVAVTATGFTATVEATLDDVFDQSAWNYVPAASARWFSITLNGDGWLTFDGPWRGIRCTVVGAGTDVVFQVAQASERLSR